MGLHEYLSNKEFTILNISYSAPHRVSSLIPAEHSYVGGDNGENLSKDRDENFAERFKES